MKKNNNQSGYVVLISVIVISAVTLTVASSLTLRAITEAKSSLDYQRGMATSAIAKACMEEGLISLRDNPLYLGESMDISNGSCTIAVTPVPEGNQLVAVAILNTNPVFVKRMVVTTRQDGNSISVVTWEESN